MECMGLYCPHVPVCHFVTSAFFSSEEWKNKFNGNALLLRDDCCGS